MKFLIIRSGPCSYELDTTVVEGRAQAQEELVSQISRHAGPPRLCLFPVPLHLTHSCSAL